ncbi:MAG: carboxypeptidase regulatory-like domain-containing protein [Candidatus Bipolaricaulia bacterium]
MGQRVALVTIAIALLTLIAGCGLFVPAPPAQISGTVVNATGGEPVIGSRVEIQGQETGFSTVLHTDGRGQFEARVEPDRYTIDVTKKGYGDSRVINLSVQKSTDIRIVQREVFNPDWPTQPPEINLQGVSDGDAFRGKIPYRIDASGANTITSIYAALDKMPGSSFMTAPRAFFSETPTSGDQKLDPRLFSARGPTTFHAVVYDINGNRTHLIRHINVVPAAGELTAPKKPHAIAVTLGQQIEFYGLKGQAAPIDSNVYVTVDWKPSDASGLTGYRVYRSFDGSNFEPIGKVHAGRTQFRDSSGQLAVGKQAYYKVTALRGAEESAATDVVSAEPLEPFSVQLISPTDEATGVSRQPTFKWRPTQRVALYHLYGVIVYDTFGSNRWVTPDKPEEFVINQTSYRWNRNNRHDGTPWERLQPQRHYQWEVPYAVAVDNLENPTAVSVAANSFGLEHDAIPIQEIGLAPTQNFGFTTGE